MRDDEVHLVQGAAQQLRCLPRRRLGVQGVSQALPRDVLVTGVAGYGIKLVDRHRIDYEGPATQVLDQRIRQERSEVGGVLALVAHARVCQQLLVDVVGPARNRAQEPSPPDDGVERLTGLPALLERALDGVLPVIELAGVLERRIRRTERVELLTRVLDGRLEDALLPLVDRYSGGHATGVHGEYPGSVRHPEDSLYESCSTGHRRRDDSTPHGRFVAPLPAWAAPGAPAAVNRPAYAPSARPKYSRGTTRRPVSAADGPS